MIDKNFIDKYTASNTAVTIPPIVAQNNDYESMYKSLKTLHDKHCLAPNNRTPELLSFVSAARSIGVDQHVVENYITNNISIAADSSKAKPQELKKMIHDSYTRYPVGNFASNNYMPAKSPSGTILYKTDYSNTDVNGIWDKYNQYRITTTSNYPVPDPIIAINGASIATAGNIMAISGLQKSGKSSLCNIILSGAISSVLDGVPQEFKIMPSDGKAVIHIDTEQAKHRQQQNLKYSILNRSGKAAVPDFFCSYNIRGLETAAAMQMLNQVFFAANETYGGIHLALIDGIADFIGSVNDEAESNAIVKLLENLASHYNTLIIAVIHRNPNDGKVRGHIGSQLLRKCEAVLAIKKDGDNSYIAPEELRTAAKGDIPKYLFKYDKAKGYHCYIGEAKAEVKLSREEQLEDFVNTKMEDGKAYRRKELSTMLCEAMGVKTDMADKLVTRMSIGGCIMVSLDKKGHWVKAPNGSFVDKNILPFEEVE